MKVLYVSSVAEDASVLGALASLHPAMDVQTVAGAAAALVSVRTDPTYEAVFLSPQLPGNEALALIATLRRDRAPIAIVAIITEDQRQFFAPALTAGADDVLVIRGTTFLSPEETLRRARQSRHLNRADGQPPLLVLFVGQDNLAWDLLLDIPFVNAERATAAGDGETPTRLTLSNLPADVVIVDEQPGDVHALQVVKWLKAYAPALSVLVLTPATGGDVGGAALDMGADDIVSKTGTYRRRLVATLHRHYMRKSTLGTTGSPNDLTPSSDTYDEDAHDEPARHPEPVEPVEPIEPVDISHIRAALVAEDRIRDLAGQVETLTSELEAGRKAYDELHEAQAFERAMRDRDREELSRIRQAHAEERERRIVLEGTLRHTEDRAATEMTTLEARHAAARRLLEDQLATAADRLHQIANDTQVLHTRLQAELAAQGADRDRLVDSHLFGYATLTQAGVIAQCNETFARLFGFERAEDVPTREPFSLLSDHAHVVQQLTDGASVDRVESVMRRTNGRAFRVVTSAKLLAQDGGAAPLVERMLIDIDDRTRVEEQLRLARRLETAGRLAAEMSSEVEPLLAAIDDPARPAADRQRAALLVRQLLAFSRRQAKPAGMLALPEAVMRAEPLLRQIAGDAVTLEFRLGDVGTISAGDDDVNQLLAGLVFAAASNLPFGGTVTIETRVVRSGFDQHTELTVGAAGYGVHSTPLSSSLVRLVSRCGGFVRVTDEPARTTTLHVHLPS